MTPASRMNRRILCRAAILLLLAGGIAQTTAPSVQVHAGPVFDYIVTILMENNGYCDVMTICGGSGTYMTSLAHAHSVVSETGYTGVVHPSEGNYVALISGDLYGMTSDCGYCPWRSSAPNIIDRIEASGRTFDLWAEDASGSGTCSFRPPRGGDHFAFISFSDMNTAARCSHFQSTTSSADTEFVNSLNSANPANYIWLTPNDSNNCHDTSIPTCDSYLAALVPKILTSTLFTTRNAALFVVYDEGNGSFPSDWLYAAWAGPVVKTGYVGTGHYSQYSYLKTLETAWGLSSLTANDANASPMTEFFGSCTSGCSSGSPTASFTVSSSSAQTGQSVTFNGAASGGTPPYMYSWDFGDGSTDMGQTVMHSYSTAGSLTAGLTVTDSASLTGTSVRTLTVSSGPTSPSNPPGQGSCALCNATGVLGTNLWLIVVGGLFVMMMSVTALYLRARGRLNEARRQRNYSRRK